MDIRFAAIDEILDLRDAVIIAGTGRDSPEFPGDVDPATRHVGVFIEGACVGCATFLRKDDEGRPAWQLRGMATAPTHRGQGLGRALLAFAERELAAEADRFWCNARETAAPFYEKMGWVRVSERFIIDGVGPHYRMAKDLLDDRS